jgi:hypothetical protein
MTRVTMVQKKPTSELFGLEHGDAQIKEHRYRHGEKDSLDPGHTRSRAQMRPSIATMKPTMPRTARKSAMESSVHGALLTQYEKKGHSH